MPVASQRFLRRLHPSLAIPMVTPRKGEDGQLTTERLFLDFWPDALTNLLRERK